MNTFYIRHKKTKKTREKAYKQESRAVARKPHDAAAVLFALKFADNIHQKFKSRRVDKHTGAKQNLTQNGHSRSSKVTCYGVSERRSAISNTKY